jgi:hypothetical protein
MDDTPILVIAPTDNGKGHNDLTIVHDQHGGVSLIPRRFLTELVRVLQKIDAGQQCGETYVIPPAPKQ